MCLSRGVQAYEKDVDEYRHEVQETGDGSTAQNGVNGHSISLASDDTLQSALADTETR